MMGRLPATSKIAATSIGLVLNYAGRKLFVFSERPIGAWKAQVEEINQNED
jgi:putative flippase GtrA